MQLITVPYNVYYQAEQVHTRKNNTNCTPCNNSVHTYYTQLCTDSNITLYSIIEQVVSFLLYQ